MKQTNEEVIKQLNNIIVINNDRIQGYERAVNETEDSDLKALFTEFASHSNAYKKELSSEVMSLGGEPTEGTKTSGKIFRAWMDMKAALTGKDRKKIISSCETGEDAALETYMDVLKSDTPFSESQRSMITKQRVAIQKDHNKIISLKHMAEAEKV
jgi:uncharacterized protein (TIGR02284 family)